MLGHTGYRPVITTPVGGIPDIADDKKNLLLFEPGNVEALAELMERMINDTVLRKKIANESVRLARTTFNLDTINRQVEHLYKKLEQKQTISRQSQAD